MMGGHQMHMSNNQNFGAHQNMNIPDILNNQ